MKEDSKIKTMLLDDLKPKYSPPSNDKQDLSNNFV